MKLIPDNYGYIFIAIDETIERRSSQNIKQKGCYRDACRSSDSLVIKCFGLKCLCAAMLITLPWSNREWALPFMTILCNSKKYDEENNKKHKTSIDKAMNLVSIFTTLFKNRKLILLGDDGFACLKLIHKCINSGVTLISKLRIDANLFEQPEVAYKGQRGRNAKNGAKIRSFLDMIKDPSTTWFKENITW